MSQVAEGDAGSRGGNISQRRLLAFPFPYPSTYLCVRQIVIASCPHFYKIGIISDVLERSLIICEK